jgi:nitrate reductase gamma subunit
MMDTWIALARGPLFRIALATCLLGLAYRFAVSFGQLALMRRQATDKTMHLGRSLAATLRWFLPWHILRKRPAYSTASVLLHVGLILVPIFYVGHANLWGGWPAWLPVLGPGPADVLTILMMVAVAVLLGGRLVVAAGRDLTTPSDVFLLVLILAIAASGYWAAHPQSAPMAPRALLLVHVLLGDLALVLTPVTKISHCVLYPLAQTLADTAWHFPAASGRHVAIALNKDEELI